MSKAPMPDSARGETPMPSSFDDDLDFWEEGRWSKLVRKLKEEPLIPVGLGLTCWALYNATMSIRRGDKEATNRWFRARVYAQGLTLLFVCAGAIYYKEEREKRKMYQGLLGEKRAREKKEAWIRELEARDREEEMARQARRERRERAAIEAGAASPTAAGVDLGDSTRAKESGAQAKGGGQSTNVGVQSTAGAKEQALKKTEEISRCPMEGGELQTVLGGSRIIGPAMWAWWTRFKSE